MSRARKALGLLAVCAVALALPGASATAMAKPQTKKVTVNDFYFGPSSVTIKKNDKIKWVWSAFNSAPHDVHLKQGPKGLKNKGTYSTKTTAVTNAQFVKQFVTPGTYKYICTIHPTEMKLTVTVKK